MIGSLLSTGRVRCCWSRKGRCCERTGVESVDAAGRITFLESRAGQLYRGYVDPRQPLARRAESGEIANSFLRPKRLDDPDGTRYLAGEMLCGVARLRPL